METLANIFRKQLDGCCTHSSFIGLDVDGASVVELSLAYVHVTPAYNGSEKDGHLHMKLQENFRPFSVTPY